MKTEISHYNPLTAMIRSAQPRTVSTIQGNAQMVAAILLASSTTAGAYSVKGMGIVMVGASGSAYERRAFGHMAVLHFDINANSLDVHSVNAAA